MCNEEFRVLITFKRNQRVIIRQLILWRQFVQKSYSESSWGQLILLTIIHKTFLFSYLAVRLSTTDLFLIFAAKLNLFHGRNPIVLDLGPWSIFDLHQSLISVNSSVLILVNSWSLSIFDPWSNSLILVNFLLILSMFPFIRMVKYHCLAPALFFFWSVYCNPPASLTSFFFFLHRIRYMYCYESLIPAGYPFEYELRYFFSYISSLLLQLGGVQLLFHLRYPSNFGFEWFTMNFSKHRRVVPIVQLASSDPIS